MAATLKPFAGNPLFTFVRVKDKKGAQVYVHRPTGLANVESDNANGELDGELFVTTPIAGTAGELGTLTLGMSLAGRDAAVVAARQTLMAIGVAAVALMVLSMQLLLRWKLEAAAPGDRE